MKRIYTVQHTQSEHHTNGMVGSWTDWNLTDLGKQQADRIAEKLKQELEGKEIILYTSDLKRAKQTADSIASRFQVEPIVRKELRERNLGRCCGKSVQWLRENLECDEKTIDDRLFSDAESRRDEWNRLKPFFDQVMAEDSENIIIVSHGDLLSVFNSMFLGLEVESLNACEMFGFAGGVSQLIVRDDGKRMIKRISDMSFVRLIPVCLPISSEKVYRRARRRFSNVANKKKTRPLSINKGFFFFLFVSFLKGGAGEDFFSKKSSPA